ncbi:MAG: hypothetical protein NVS9B15_11230 [Acidobacteriaceae bacterium]
MTRPFARGTVIALIFLFLGVAGAAAVFAYLPDPGSTPSVYDDFNWNSTANGFWHVNAIGSTADISHGRLTLSGHSIELDHRLQTDPRQTVVVVKVRGESLHKFGVGIGVYHAGTVGMEFDDDGVKCGRGTDYGWKVDYVRSWTQQPLHQWFYLAMVVTNPYPDTVSLKKAEKSDKPLKPVTLTCFLYDGSGRLLSRVVPTDPRPNAHYVAFDEVFVRTWDSRNRYQVDWIYAGPPSGNPSRHFLAGL